MRMASARHGHDARPPRNPDCQRHQQCARGQRDQQRPESREDLVAQGLQEGDAEKVGQLVPQSNAYGSGNFRHSSSARSCTESRAAGSSIRSTRSARQSAIVTISGSRMPRVVTSGVPTRTPLGLNFDASSYGIEFRFSVMPTVSAMSCTALPVRFCGRRTMSIRWLTAPPLTNLSPRSCNRVARSEEHTSELQSHLNLVCRLLLEKKKYT